MKTILIFLTLIMQTAWAGNVVGNGGDYVRETFFAVGRAVVKFVQESPEAKLKLAEAKISVEDLTNTLSIDIVKVTEDKLVDNGGSVVDAKGEPGSILINKFSWFEHFERGRDVYSLVLHEMLRAKGVNDDNYVFSSVATPFPTKYKVPTRISAFIPLIAEDNLQGIIGSQVVSGGNGCNNQNPAKIELDRERNILELVYSNFSVDGQSLSADNKRKTCSIAIPFNLPPKKRLVISLLDTEAQVKLESDSKVKLSSEVFMVGTKAPILSREIKAKSGETLTGGVLIRRTDLLKSKCGQTSIVRVSNSVLSLEKQSGRSADLSIAKSKIYFTLEECK